MHGVIVIAITILFIAHQHHVFVVLDQHQLPTLFFSIVQQVHLQQIHGVMKIAIHFQQIVQHLYVLVLLVMHQQPATQTTYYVLPNPQLLMVGVKPVAMQNHQFVHQISVVVKLELVQPLSHKHTLVSQLHQRQLIGVTLFATQEHFVHHNTVIVQELL